MNFCTKCGHKRTEGAAFCGKCGSAFAKQQQGTPPPPQGYAGYYQQPGYQTEPADFPDYSQNIEKPKRSLYDKIYRDLNYDFTDILLYIVLGGVGLFIAITILTFTMIEDTLHALLIFFSSMVVIPMAIVMPIIISYRKFTKSPVITERVVLLYKQFESGLSFTFEFPDGSQESLLLRGKHIDAEKMFDFAIAGDSGTLMYQKLDDRIQFIDFVNDNDKEGDSGTLVYQERNGKTRLTDFENDNYKKDNHSRKPKRSLYDKIHNTLGSEIFTALTTAFSLCILITGVVFAFEPLFNASYSGNWYSYTALIVLAVLLPIAIIGFLHLPSLFARAGLKSRRKKRLRGKEKQTRAKLIDKGQFGKYVRRVLVFELADKSIISLQVRETDIDGRALVNNDTGILTYKERKGEPRFISFEQDKKGFFWTTAFPFNGGVKIQRRDWDT